MQLQTHVIPSTTTTSKYLLNLATGRAASQETQEYQTGSLSTGHELCVKFQEECVADKKSLLKNPKEKLKRRQTTTKEKSVAESMRDVFIHLPGAAGRRFYVHVGYHILPQSPAIPESHPLKTSWHLFLLSPRKGPQNEHYCVGIDFQNLFKIIFGEINIPDYLVFPSRLSQDFPCDCQLHPFW